MDFAGEKYYKLSRILLLCLGLWPYHKSVLKKVQVIFFEVLSVSFLLCQLYTFFVRRYNVDIFVKVSSFMVINSIFIVQYNAFLLLADNIKYIFDRVRDDWNILNSQAEMKIIQGYADNARLSTIVFTSLAVISSMGCAGLSCLPSILDLIIPMNESRTRRQLIITEYFVDQETYFYGILIHIIAICYVGTVTLAAVATVLGAYSLHVCAMFKIASYRIEHIFDKTLSQVSKDVWQCTLYKKLIYAVYVHRRAADLANIMTNSFASLYVVMLGLGIVSTSLSTFCLLNAAVSLNDEVEILLFASIISVHLYYIFLANFVGQEVIDTSTCISQSTYNTQWYVAPLWAQKMLLFIMQRSGRSSSLVAGGLFQASLEGFATIISMSMSYVMVINSIRLNKENH